MSLSWTYLRVLESLLRRWGSAVTHWRGKDTGARGPREYWLAWALPEVTILASRPGPTRQPTGSSASTPQANQQDRNTAPPSADRLPKAVLSSQPPLNTPIDTALPSRETQPSSTHQRAGTSPSHQEACTSPGPTSPTRGQTPETRRATVLQPAEGDHENRKLEKNEMAEKHVPDKGTR